MLVVEFAGRYDTPDMRDVGSSSPRRLTIAAIEPETGRKEVNVLVPTHRIQWAKRMGKGAILEVGDSVRQVLESPAKIFRGIRRDRDDDRGQTEGWLCYSGKPNCRYDYESGKSCPPGNRVLLVFVNKDCVYYVHRWEEEDEHNPGQPRDCDGRFKEHAL